MANEQKKQVNPSPDKSGSGQKTTALREHWPWVVGVVAALVVITVVLCLAAVLASSPAGPAAAVDCVTVQEKPAEEDRPVKNQHRAWVDNQVILTGPASQIKEVAGGFGLEPIRTCDLNYLRELEHGGDLPFDRSELNELATHLYSVPPQSSVEELIKMINAPDTKVFADPNLILGLPQSVCGNPHSNVGSPFGGAPKLLPVGEEASAKQFWEQWAFRLAGVGPYFKDETAGAAILHQGEGILVGVFDTSPFLDPWDGLAGAPKSTVLESEETVKWLNPTMDLQPLGLKVSYPEIVSDPVLAPLSVAGDAEEVADVRDHGLFVSGLVHATAPASEIHLIRVLNEQGCGSLFALNEALGQFTGKLKQERGTLENVIINLSLGVHDPEGVYATAGCSGDPGDADIVSLCTTLTAASKAGAVIVAASGNDSDEVTVPLEAQIPAGYDFVIGVQATNDVPKLACFSNSGDVSAPGGDGGPVDGKACAPVVRLCEAECPTAVIGPVLFPPKGDAYWPTHYAYWAGTSFAAPLASGQAALLLEGGVPPANVLAVMTNTAVEEVINLPKSVEP